MYGVSRGRSAVSTYIEQSMRVRRTGTSRHSRPYEEWWATRGVQSFVTCMPTRTHSYTRTNPRTHTHTRARIYAHMHT